MHATVLIVLGMFGLIALIPVIVAGTPAGGRPLRIRGRVALAAAREDKGWAENATIDPKLSTAAREALADAWLRAARDEHASIPAFARIATSLVALGGPRELIEGCHHAALDEIDHAQRCFTLASAYAGRTFAPGPLLALLTPEREVRDPAVHLRRLALETVEDGCLGEGIAAELAREGYARASDTHVKATLAVIAKDEARHHELAWKILRWCCSVGGAGLRDAVRDKLHQLPRTIMPPRVDARIAGELVQHGQVIAERKREIYFDMRTYIIERATWILDGFDVRAA